MELLQASNSGNTINPVLATLRPPSSIGRSISAIVNSKTKGVLHIQTRHTAHLSEGAHPFKIYGNPLDVAVALQMEADALDVDQRLRSSILQERHHGAHTKEEKFVLLVE